MGNKKKQWENNRNRKHNHFYSDADLKSFKNQLNNVGFQLIDILGDGNCLFRSLCDQIDGSDHNHLDLRKAVCDYMQKNQDYFAPFVPDVSFPKYLAELRQGGTYAGNDVIAAFAQMHKITLLIHQLNNPVWRVDGGAGSREIHIAYHEGEHYSSVRPINQPDDNNFQPQRTLSGRGREKPERADATKGGKYKARLAKQEASVATQNTGSKKQQGTKENKTHEHISSRNNQQDEHSDVNEGAFANFAKEYGGVVDYDDYITEENEEVLQAIWAADLSENGQTVDSNKEGTENGVESLESRLTPTVRDNTGKKNENADPNTASNSQCVSGQSGERGGGWGGGGGARPKKGEARRKKVEKKTRAAERRRLKLSQPEQPVDTTPDPDDLSPTTTRILQTLDI